jgi:hypothetical protein
MIKFKCGYKYQLSENYELGTRINIPNIILENNFISMSESGLLFIKKGYAWDGPSGPTLDTENFMRGSLVHDALYQLMREGYLDPKVYKKQADALLVSICEEDGMTKLRAWWVLKGLQLGGWQATQPRTNEVITTGKC